MIVIAEAGTLNNEQARTHKAVNARFLLMMIHTLLIKFCPPYVQKGRQCFIL